MCKLVRPWIKGASARVGGSLPAVPEDPSTGRRDGFGTQLATLNGMHAQTGRVPGEIASGVAVFYTAKPIEDGCLHHAYALSIFFRVG